MTAVLLTLALDAPAPHWGVALCLWGAIALGGALAWVLAHPDP